MTLALSATRALLRLRPRSTGSIETFTAAVRARREPAPVPDAVHKIATVTESNVDGRRIIHLTSRREPPQAHLVYLHGGCYSFPLITPHWGILRRLLSSAAVSIDVPLYGLAPEHTAPEALDLLQKVYDSARTSHDRVFVGGDSAGGGLALAAAQRYRDAGLDAPRGILLISPWVDVTMSNPEIPAIEPLDRMLGVPGLIEAGRMWAGDLDTRDPRVSPLYGDLAGLPPVHTYQGDRDVLAPDARELTRRILRSGRSAELRLTRGGFHVFPGAPWLPEARLALSRMAEVLRG